MSKGKRTRRHAVRRSNRMSQNLKLILWLIFLFPVGLTMMWQRKCSWNYKAKLAVTSLVVMLFVAVIIYPSPSNNYAGGVELIGAEPEGEVYGPEMPNVVEDQYVTAVSTSSVLADTSYSENEDDTNMSKVYIYNGAQYYHKEGCKYVYAASTQVTVYEAHYLGYAPCAECNPPAYVGH